MRRRRPGCGSELPHAPHEYQGRFKWDGTPLPSMPEDHAGPLFCTGWTETEAALCVMLREVHRAMLERARTDRKYRLEISGGVSAGLAGLHIPDLEDLQSGRRLTHVHGAELWLAELPPGRWRLAEVPPALAEGTVP